MADVFISYKAEEYSEANWVKTTLETNGISCWMAPMSIPGGSNYAVEIPRAIRAAKAFVLILSEKSQLSKWVPRELDQAINESKTILPFMLENCPLRDDFVFYLSNVQRYAAYENKTVALEKMINQIRAIIEASGKMECGHGDNIPNNQEDTSEIKPDGSTADYKRTEKTAARKSLKLAEANKVSNGDKKRRGKVKPLFVAIGAVAMTAVIALIVAANSITIAGKHFNKSDSYITLQDTELSSDDIAALSKFKKLGAIYLTNCVIPDNSLNTIFTTVLYRVELENCDLSNEDLSQVDFRDVTVNAISLDENQRLTDLNGLSSLGERLQELSFNQCSVSDIAFAEPLVSLRKLSFDSNNVDDISALSKCVNLERISAANNNIESLSALSTCTKLEEVSVGSNELYNLNGLEQSIYIKKIYASDNAISDINGIQNATLLKEVDLCDNDVEDITLLRKSRGNLQKLNLSNNNIENIDALSECSMIVELDISHNRIEKLDAISELTAIKSLNASNNRITDISGLKNSGKLINADLSNNLITDVSPLLFDESAYGISLDVSHNAITTLVIPQTKYEYLALFGNPISDLSSVSGTSGSTLVFDYDPTIDFEMLGKSDYRDYYIIDCPLDRQVSVSIILGSHKVHYVSEEYIIT